MPFSEYGKTPAQVVLSWGANHDIAVVPKSTNEKRLKENIGIFELETDDLAKLDKIDKAIRYNDASEDFGYSCGPRPASFRLAPFADFDPRRFSFFSNEKAPELVKKQMLKDL